MEKVVTFVKEKETKNTVRFTEEGPWNEQVIQTLYVQKSCFGGKIPDNIEVVIKF